MPNTYVLILVMALVGVGMLVGLMVLQRYLSRQSSAGMA